MSDARAQAAIETILDDRPCAECGYNLKGLSAVGVCPECGEPIGGARYVPLSGRARRVVDDSELGQASLLFLLPLGLALFWCGAAGLGLLAALWMLRSGNTEPLWVRGGCIAASVWYLGVLVLMRDRPLPRGAASTKHSSEPWWPLKLLLVLTQPAWIALPVLYQQSAVGAAWADAARLAVFWAGSFGLPIYCVVIASLAEWANDEGLASRLRAAAWALGFGLIVPIGFATVELIGFPGLGLLIWVLHLANLVWLLGFIAMAVFAFEMLIDVRWAIINARERAESHRRMEERRRRREAAKPEALAGGVPLGTGGIVTTAPPAAKPAESPGRIDPPAVRPAGEHVIARRDDVTPYRLEDTDPGPGG